MDDPHPLRSLLVATDLQTTSAEVIALAGMVARKVGDLGIVLLHVVQQDDDDGVSEMHYQRTEADARRALELQAETLRESGVRVDDVCVVRHRSPHGAILDELEERGSDLVMVGTHSRRSTPHRLGSTADRVLRKTPVPCLVVRGRGPEAPGLRRAAVLSDGSPVGREALSLALAWLPRLGAADGHPLEVLRVGNPEVQALDPDHGTRLEERVEEDVRAARKELGAPAASVRILWGHDVVDRVLQEAEGEGYDLLVVGTHGYGAVVRWLVGSVALGLAQAAACPVLVVPPPGRRAAADTGGGAGKRTGAEQDRDERASPPVRTFMSAPVVAVPLGTSLAEAAGIMLDRDVGSVLCVDAEGRVRGIVTDSDFAARSVGIPFSTFRAPQLLGRWLDEGGVERIYREARERTVDEVMSEPVHAVDEDATVEEVLDLMLRRDLKHVPVVRDRRPVGMVARHDLLRFLLDRIRP